MANCTDETTTAIDDIMSHQSGAAAHTGDSHQPSNNNQTDKDATHQTTPSRHRVEGQRENLIYSEDLGFLPMRKDPRYAFYRHPKQLKFDVKNEDILQNIEQANLLEHLELLQISRSNKSIEIRFDTEKAAQQFVDCEISVNGDSLAFRSNAQRRLRVSIHGVHPTIPDAALEYELSPYFGGVLDIKRDTKQYKNKVYETGTRTFLVTELFQHIPRSCRIMNRWCLVYYTGQPYTARKPQTEMESRQNNEPSNSDKEESMSTSNTDSNSQKDLSDDRSDASFQTVEEKDIGFTSKRNIDTESEAPTSKKQKSDKDNCFDMGLTIQQLTTIVRELEEHEFRNVAEVLGEDRSDEIDGVISNMICLVETARDISNVPSEQLVLYDKLQKKREKQISTEAMHDSFVHTGFYKKHFLRMKRLRDERASQPPP